MRMHNRLSRAAERLAASLPRVATRGQLGPVNDTELARLTGARR